LVLACFQCNGQDYFFLTPIGKNISQYRDRITCIMWGAEEGQPYSDTSKCSAYRLNSSDSFRFDKVDFNLMILFRDSGQIINAVSFNKTIRDEKRSKQLRQANEEFRLMSKYLDNFCGSQGVIKINMPAVKDQEYKVISWKRGLLKFTLQQVDIRRKKGFSSIEFFIQRSP